MWGNIFVERKRLHSNYAFIRLASDIDLHFVSQLDVSITCVSSRHEEAVFAYKYISHQSAKVQ